MFLEGVPHLPSSHSKVSPSLGVDTMKSLAIAVDSEFVETAFCKLDNAAVDRVRDGSRPNKALYLLPQMRRR